MEENILYTVYRGKCGMQIAFFIFKEVRRHHGHIEVLSKDTFCMKNKIYICICMHVFAGCKYYFCLHLISASKI